MRVFLSLLAPFFLNFAGVEADVLYSISWQDTTPSACNAEEAMNSLDAITAAVDVALNLPTAVTWKFSTSQINNRERELQGDCTSFRLSRCSISSCRKGSACYVAYSCHVCGYRRQLIQTERVLTDRELQALESDLIYACEVALDSEGHGGDYSPNCKTTMIAATCNAVVTDTSTATEWVSHPVCQNFAVHAATTVTFDGVQTTIYGGDVGVSPGSSITGDAVLRGGKVVADSTGEPTAFATHVSDAHAAKIATSPSSTTADTEIGGQTFYPGTHKFDSAINIAFGTTVTLDGVGDYLFIAGSTLITGADTSVVLINGAKAENVLWALGTAATLGARSVVEGSILAGTDITFGTQSELHGCALAQSGVTFETAGSVFQR
jgi:hypothetical protein